MLKQLDNDFIKHSQHMRDEMLSVAMFMGIDDVINLLQDMK